VEESRRRQQNREAQSGQSADRLESERDQFHRNVRHYYLKLAREEKNWLVIDGGKKAEEIFEELKTYVSQTPWLRS
jgi:thymidylate kinase